MYKGLNNAKCHIRVLDIGMRPINAPVIGSSYFCLLHVYGQMMINLSENIDTVDEAPC